MSLLTHQLLFWLMLVWLSVFTTVVLWPASYWFEVTRIEVLDTKEGEPVFMVVDRTIKRQFVGQYSLVVRKLTVNGWVIECATGPSAEIDYSPDSVLQDPLTLEWWTGSKCFDLGEGSYRLTTNWTILGGNLLPDKRVSRLSNVFIVNPYGFKVN